MKFILFDILENLILQKSLAFGNIVSFLEVNWVRKWIKTFNFGNVQFEP